MNEIDLIRNLLNEGEVRSALEAIRISLTAIPRDSLNSGANDRLNTVTLMMGQLARIDREYLNGTISSENRRVSENDLTSRALMLLSTIDQSKANIPKISTNFSYKVAEKITSTQSHLRPTGWIARGLRVATCVCRLNCPDKRGTAFLIDNDIIITNNHVIGSESVSLDFFAEFLYEHDESGAELTPRSLRLDSSRLFATCEKLDLTAIALAGSPGDDLYRAKTDQILNPMVGEHLNIIQHPSGGYKHMAITNNLVVNIFGDFVQYMTDTLPGSSGSPVFDDKWRLIAVHHAGGDIIKNAKGEKLFANEGTLLSRAKEISIFKKILAN